MPDPDLTTDIACCLGRDAPTASQESTSTPLGCSRSLGSRRQPDAVPPRTMLRKYARTPSLRRSRAMGRRGMVDKAEMRTLPIEGLELRELVVAGNGKDAEVCAVAS